MTVVPRFSSLLLHRPAADRVARCAALALSLTGLGAQADLAQAASPQVIDTTGRPVATNSRFEPNEAGQSGRSAIAEPFFVVAEESKSSKENAPEALPLPPTTPVELTPAQQYCSNVLDAAAAAQIAQQTSRLETAQKQLDERVALLARKTEELRLWIKKREDFTAHATDSLVQMYSKMKPEAAAGQLTAMDELMASAIVSKLSPKANSLILAEMDATKAARLSAVIAGAGEIAMKPEQKADGQQ